MRNDYSDLFYALASYLRRAEISSENDLVQLYNNISVRKANAYDHFELLVAHSRYEAVQEICSDIWKLLAIYGKK